MPDHVHFVTKSYTLYRRGELFIKDNFDEDGSESSKNSDYMGLYGRTGIVDENDSNRPLYDTYDKVYNKMKNTSADGTSYWSLVIHGGWLEYFILPEFNPHCLCEVIYDYSNPGTGQLDIWLNGKFMQSKIGPSSWRRSHPHMAIDNIELLFRQRNFGISEPKGRAEIDNFLVYKYDELVCEICEYTPPKTTAEPKTIETLQGFDYSQTTRFMGTLIEMSLRFDDKDSHSDFIKNSNKIHVFCDDKCIFYRGAITLGEARHIGLGVFEQKISFKSPNQIGEGWI